MAGWKRIHLSTMFIRIMQLAQQAGVYLYVWGYKREYKRKSELILPKEGLRINQMLCPNAYQSVVCCLSHVWTRVRVHRQTLTQKSQIPADKNIYYKILPGHLIYYYIIDPLLQMLSVKNALILICLWLMCGVKSAFIKQAWSTSTGGVFN